MSKSEEGLLLEELLERLLPLILLALLEEEEEEEEDHQPPKSLAPPPERLPRGNERNNTPFVVSEGREDNEGKRPLAVTPALVDEIVLFAFVKEATTVVIVKVDALLLMRKDISRRHVFASKGKKVKHFLRIFYA